MLNREKFLAIVLASVAERGNPTPESVEAEVDELLTRIESCLPSNVGA